MYTPKCDVHCEQCGWGVNGVPLHGVYQSCDVCGESVTVTELEECPDVAYGREQEDRIYG